MATGRSRSSDRCRDDLHDRDAAEDLVMIAKVKPRYVKPKDARQRRDRLLLQGPDLLSESRLHDPKRAARHRLRDGLRRRRQGRPRRCSQWTVRRMEHQARRAASRRPPGWPAIGTVDWLFREYFAIQTIARNASPTAPGRTTSKLMHMVCDLPTKNGDTHRRPLDPIHHAARGGQDLRKGHRRAAR